jgi:hypothetical protein
MVRPAPLISIALLWVIGITLVQEGHSQPETEVRRGNLTNIGEILNVLRETGFEPVILEGEDQRKMVIVTPQLVGRVMCMSLDGVDGKTNAFVNEKQLREGRSRSGYAAKPGPEHRWNNFGAAERIWFAPEGGKFGFFFDPGVEQNWDTYRMSYPLHEIPYKVINRSVDGKSVTFWAPIQLTNYRGYPVHVEMTRKVTILESCPFTLGFGDRVEAVGFESKTWAKNVGNQRLNKDSTPFALWTVGIFNSGNQVIVLLPYRKGPVAELGEPVTTEYFRYFANVPGNEALHSHWSVKDGCVLIKADGKAQTKLEMFKRRSLGRLASINLQDFTMTIVDFELYPEMDYAASFFLPYEGDLLDGGVMSSFMNTGEVNNPEKPAIYELEVCSPILELQPNEQFCHLSRTYQLRGDPESIARICERFFNVDLGTLEAFDRQSR